MTFPAGIVASARVPTAAHAIPGCWIALHASDLSLSNGAPVNVWPSRVGSVTGIPENAAAGREPTFGNDGAKYVSVDQFKAIKSSVDSPVAGNNARHVFFRYRHPSAGDGTFFGMGGAVDGRAFDVWAISSTSLIFHGYGSAWDNVPGVVRPAPGTWVTVEMSWDGSTNLYMAANGSTRNKSGQTALNTASVPMRLGQGSYNNLSSPTHFAAVYVFNRLLTTAERAVVKATCDSAA